MRTCLLALVIVLGACQLDAGGRRRSEPAPKPSPEAALPPAGAPPPGEVPALTPPSRVKVLEVVDGDTLLVRLERRKEKVRLLGVRAPKADSSRQEEEYFGREAKAFVEEQLLDRPVKLRFLSARDRDKFERLLAYVEVEGKDFNAKLVRKGYAFAQSGGDHPRREEYERLEREARRKKRGMWARPADGR